MNSSRALNNTALVKKMRYGHPSKILDSDGEKETIQLNEVTKTSAVLYLAVHHVHLVRAVRVIQEK